LCYNLTFEKEGGNPMSKSKISRFVVWLCSKFSRQEIERIITELTSILKKPDSKFGPRDEFKEEHPNYRNFEPDPTEPLAEPPASKKKRKRTIR
jgi:hypothetical protein